MQIFRAFVANHRIGGVQHLVGQQAGQAQQRIPEGRGNDTVGKIPRPDFQLPPGRRPAHPTFPDRARRSSTPPCGRPPAHRCEDHWPPARHGRRDFLRQEHRDNDYFEQPAENPDLHEQFVQQPAAKRLHSNNPAMTRTPLIRKASSPRRLRLKVRSHHPIIAPKRTTGCGRRRQSQSGSPTIRSSRRAAIRASRIPVDIERSVQARCTLLKASAKRVSPATSGASPILSQDGA